MSNYVYLKDYQEPNYSIETVDLTVEIKDEFTIVESIIELKKTNSSSNELFLNGENLELLEIKYNGENLAESRFKVDKNGLHIYEGDQEFHLYTKVKIFPEQNKACEGLYRSGEILCTQNEPEGFRKITYFIDRPDNLSIFRCKIIADKKKYPVLLANGNLIDQGDLNNQQHYAYWEDPFKKPSYLFALVAGNLAVITDKFETISGKNVDLYIYTDPGEENKAFFAMSSLKKSMKWDEERFGLEYDLNRYTIVAVHSFNFGAMENKALNIFNAKYVLAKPDTATDNDYMGIENVIGHEYFHNYTGNRVTCRDWFQLTLKEGLTVFRDQEFSSDVFSRAMKRLQDVQIIKSVQFKEDKGPLSHPIRPEQYKEINNFYTSTVYNKGAEVIRMLYSIFGNEAFVKSVQSYLKRFDGMAVTTEDFISVFEEINNKNLYQFKNWYKQKGTPKIHIDTNFIDNTYTVSVKQALEKDQEAFYFPLDFALISMENGQKIIEKQLMISETQESFEFKNIQDKKAVPSLLRSFSAPVNIDYNYTNEELICLLKSDDDFYNRYESAQILFSENIDKEINHDFISTTNHILACEKTDNYLKSVLLNLPNLEDLFNYYNHFDIDRINGNRKKLKSEIYKRNKTLFFEIYERLSEKKYEYNPISISERKLKALCLSYLSVSDEYFDFIFESYKKTDNMTDRLSHIKALLNSKFRDQVIDDFIKDFGQDTLTITQILKLIANEDSDELINNIKDIERSSYFKQDNPNHIRSLYGIFSHNWAQFHKKDGSSYKLYCERIKEIDHFNPQISAGLAKQLQIYYSMDLQRKELLANTVMNVIEKNKRSNDLDEILTSIFGE